MANKKKVDGDDWEKRKSRKKSTPRKKESTRTKKVTRSKSRERGEERPTTSADSQETNTEEQPSPKGTRRSSDR